DRAPAGAPRPATGRRADGHDVEPAEAEGPALAAAEEGANGTGTAPRPYRRRRGPIEVAGAHDVAAGRRAVHHVAARHHEGPCTWRRQHGHVPHAGTGP